MMAQHHLGSRLRLLRAIGRDGLWHTTLENG
jgi:hypothetical protein